MTHTHRSSPPATEATGHRTRRPGFGSLRQARIQRVFEGVVASYIHEISVRSGSPHMAR
jgi:hypothetical protein